MPNRFTIKTAFFFLSLFFFIQFTKAQITSPTKDAIVLAFENYFEQDRENIYVQLDKKLFFTHESIWFKGYVYNKKLNTPFYSTTNVYVQLMSESGEIITNQLLYSMNGVFSGKIKLDKKIISGYYYLQFYTNWMNNFVEDESYVQRIKIKSADDKTIPLLDGINAEKINVEFYPEGGNLIHNVSNIVGIKITDANGVPIPNCSLEILESDNNQYLKTVAINNFGMGKFEITPNNQNYKAVVIYKDKKAEYNLPNSTSNGISLELNNYAFEDKTSVKIKYNKEHEKMYKNKTVFLVIQKNETSNIIDVLFDTDNCKKEFLFSNEMLFNGINSVRIIDSEMNEIAHRLLFKPEIKDSRVSLNVGFKDDQRVEISGSSNWIDACVSATLLPTETKITTTDNLYTCLHINSYLNDKLNLQRDYFNEINRAKKYEIDLMLLNQKSNKYNWQTIKKSKPRSDQAFEKGITLKGIINSPSGNLTKYRIQLKNILSEVLASTETIENREFFLENTNVTDSMGVFCDLIDTSDRLTREMNYNLIVINKNKKYNKNFQPTPYIFPEVKDPNLLYDINMSWLDEKSILLKEVELKKEKNKLKRQSHSGNSYLRGYKVGVDVSLETDVLYFIEQNGFTVSRIMGAINITGRNRTSLRGGSTTPIVYIDGRQLMDFEELSGLRMDDLDEIYISAHAIVPSINNNHGIIKIYRKQPDFTLPNSKSKMKTIVGGFEVIPTFENAEYTSEFTPEFENFGLIYWSPWILTDQNGNLKITIENKNHKKAKIIIEGFTMDGKLISEEREILLE